MYVIISAISVTVVSVAYFELAHSMLKLCIVVSELQVVLLMDKRQFALLFVNELGK
jgi:hypothetical protein